jgi:hypothetical protein
MCFILGIISEICPWDGNLLVFATLMLLLSNFNIASPRMKFGYIHEGLLGIRVTILEFYRWYGIILGFKRYNILDMSSMFGRIRP